MVKLQLPKLAMRVRFPLLAPKGKDTEGCPFLLEKITGARDRFKLRQKEPVFEKLVQLDQLAVGEVWVQIPVTRSIAKGTPLGVPFAMEKVMVASTRFKLRHKASIST